MKTLKILSSTYFEMYNTLLLTIVILIQNFEITGRKHIWESPYDISLGKNFWVRPQKHREQKQKETNGII